MTKTPYFLSAATWLLATTAIAQELPQGEALTGLVSGTTPPYWTISELEVVATSRSGEAARPQAQIRFEADAAPEADLFAEASREGPFIIVTPTQEQGSVRRLYGYLDLTYAAGQWDGPVVIENPVNAFGQPRDMFLAPTLVAGTDDADSRLAALRNNAIAGAIALHETAMSELVNQHQTALSELQAEHTKALGQARSRQSEELSQAETEASNAIAAERSAGELRLSELRLQYEGRLSQLTTSQEPLIAAAEAERAEMLAAEQTKADEALDVLRAEHAERRGSMIETQRQEIAELETRLATERASLQRQLETAQDTITLQQELLAAMESRAAGAEQVLAAFNTARETRRTFYARIPKNWAGQAICKTSDDSYNATFPISIQFNQHTTTGFTGFIAPANAIGRNSAVYFDVSLTGSDDSLALPMTMRLQSSANNSTPSAEVIRFLNDFDIEMGADGRMTASFDRPINVDNVQKVATCNLRLGVREG